MHRLFLLLAMLVVAPVLAAPAKDWSRHAVRKPDGAFVLGNPAAKVRLVEYLSFTCPHCGQVAREASLPLRQRYIATGLVSFEVRHALRDGIDLTAALLSRCAGPVAFFPAEEAVFARQDAWLAKAAELKQDELNALPLPQRLGQVARTTGLDMIVKLPAPRVNACLADAAERDLLGRMADEAWSGRKIPGTPAFFINGAATAQVGSWAELEPMIRAALAR